MSREVLIIRWCDNHEDQVTATVERTVSVDGAKVLTLDLCEECDAGFIQPVLWLVEEYGVTPDAAFPRKKKATAKATKAHTEGNVCPVCGFESVSRDSLGQHLRMRHGKGIRDFPEELPMPKKERLTEPT